MRVPGCGVSSPPDKRQFSSVDSEARNPAIRSDAGEPGVGSNDSRRSSPARTFIESAESSTRRSGASGSALARVVKDFLTKSEDRKRRVRGSKDRRRRDSASLHREEHARQVVGQRRFHVRATCLVLGKTSRKHQLYGILDSRVPPSSSSGAEFLRTRSDSALGVRTEREVLRFLFIFYVYMITIVVVGPGR
ncbi:unnamed protein product [Lasius platythorax]|uniref:Uncharacterized protein n=1 Tax=Lasius platythorax TaxID=488582 RepID=A0AAV2P832_9HYME